jgi:hypothetical protein
MMIGLQGVPMKKDNDGLSVNFGLRICQGSRGNMRLDSVQLLHIESF